MKYKSIRTVSIREGGREGVREGRGGRRICMKECRMYKDEIKIKQDMNVK